MDSGAEVVSSDVLNTIPLGPPEINPDEVEACPSFTHGLPLFFPYVLSTWTSLATVGLVLCGWDDVDVKQWLLRCYLGRQMRIRVLNFILKSKL